MARQATAQRTAQPQAAAPQQAPTGNLPATQENKPAHPLTVLKGQLEERQNEFAFALPEHIPVQRFTRVVLTAVQNNPKLLICDRASFFNSALKAAQDGLLPDGREGAIVEFKDKSGKVLAQWLPMYQGLLKKVRNSGEFKWMTAQIVYEGDQFDHWIDQEGEHFTHKPAGLTTIPVRAYSAVTTQSGGCFVEVMTMPQVRKVQAASRAKSEYGPWAKWFDEMAKKTVFRRLAKRLPLSSDLDDLIRRDDALYDFEGQRDEAQVARQSAGRLSTVAAFDRFAGDPQTIDHDPETGEVIDADFGSDDAGAQDTDFGGADDAAAAQEAEQQAQREAEAKRQEEARKKAEADAAAAKKAAADKAAAEKAAAEKAAADKAAAEKAAAEKADKPPVTSQAQADARAIDTLADGGAGEGGASDPGVDAERRWPNGAVPANADEYESYAETKLSDFSKAGDVAPWWKSQAEIDLRKACGVPQDMFQRILKKAQDRVAELSKKK